MFIGTDRFSNCRECGQKVAVGLYECPHCRKVHPHTRNVLGWRVGYSKALDPSVPKRSFWLFAVPSWMRFLSPSLIVTIVIAGVVDYLFPGLLASLFGLFGQPVDPWHGILYLILFFVLMLCLVDMARLKR